VNKQETWAFIKTNEPSLAILLQEIKDPPLALLMVNTYEAFGNNGVSMNKSEPFPVREPRMQPPFCGDPKDKR